MIIGFHSNSWNEWSCSRQFVFQRCPRFYYFRYIVSSGEAINAESATLQQQVLSLLNARKPELWMIRNDLMALFHSFIEVQKSEISLAQLSYMTWQKLRQKGYSVDFINLINHQLSTSMIYEIVLDCIQHPLEWIPTPSVDFIFVDTMKVWLTPGLAKHREGFLTVYRWDRKVIQSSNLHDHLQNYYYGLNYPHSVRECRIRTYYGIGEDETSGEWKEFFLTGFEESEKIIFQFILHWRDYFPHSNSNVWVDLDFVKKEDNHCSFCLFRNICK